MYVSTPQEADQCGERTVVSVVVPSKNKLEYVTRCLDSLLASIDAFGSAELIVVDHGSEDGSYEIAAKRCRRRCRIIQVFGGTISHVRNLGAAEAAGDILCFVDADCVVLPDYVAEVTRVLEETGATAVGCKVGLPENPTWVEAVWHHLHVHEGNGYRRWMNSANFAIRRSAFEEIGGFAEHLVTGEDTEVCQRLLAAGGTIYEDQRLRVQHLDNARTLVAFFRKEHWRALGMFGTVSRYTIDRPLVATLAHLAAIVTAVVIAMLPTVSAGRAVIAAVVLFMAVPTISVIYRQRQFNHFLLGARALALYAVYLTARCAALASLAWRRIKQSAPSR